MGKEDFLDIDLLRLDEEWKGQPCLYHEHAAMLADARRDYEKAKANFDVVKAELFLEICSNPEAFSLAKTTERMLESAVCSHERYKEAQQAVIDLKHDVAIHEAAVAALDHRKKALEKEVDLFLSDYYSAPKASREESKEFIQEKTRYKDRVKAKPRKPKLLEKD